MVSSCRIWVWASPEVPGSSMAKAIAMLSGEIVTFAAGESVRTASNISTPNASTARPARTGSPVGASRGASARPCNAATVPSPSGPLSWFAVWPPSPQPHSKAVSTTAVSSPNDTRTCMTFRRYSEPGSSRTASLGSPTARTGRVENAPFSLHQRHRTPRNGWLHHPRRRALEFSGRRPEAGTGRARCVGSGRATIREGRASEVLWMMARCLFRGGWGRWSRPTTGS